MHTKLYAKYLVHRMNVKQIPNEGPMRKICLEKNLYILYQRVHNIVDKW